MDSVEKLRYSLGFLVGAGHEKVASHFRAIDFPLPLSVHPKTRIAVAHNGAELLAILGEAVHPDLPHLDLEGVAGYLLAHAATRQDEIDKLVGRFAVIQADSTGELRVQTDVIGLRSVYFSVSDRGVIAGSHPRLVAETAPGGAKRKGSAYKWGYPGLTTPFEAVSRLPPNCELSLVTGFLHRFFPKTAIPERAIDEAWAFAFDRAGTTIAALAGRRNLLLSLSGGLDTRTTLAASRASWPHLAFFTYFGSPKHRIDAKVAEAIAATLGIRHTFVSDTPQAMDKAVLRIVRHNNLTSHKPQLACAYHRQFGEHHYVHVRSNLLELGRSNLFKKFGKRPRFRQGPATPQLMASLYTVTGKLSPEKSTHVLPAFEHNFVAADCETALCNASPWDLYFIEHRMGAWQAGVVAESDVSFDTIIAFNSREIVRQFMGVPQEERCSSSHLYQRLNDLLPEIADVPINPKQYPLPAA